MLVEFLKNEEGSAAVEYGLMASLISVSVLTATEVIGVAISDTFELLQVVAANVSSPIFLYH